MTIQDIMNAWQPEAVNVQVNVDLWNGKAAHFGELKLPTPQNSIGMRLIQKEKMVKPGSSVLDVGCGGGRFSFALEQMGANVLGVDFSPNMIEECHRNKAERNAYAQFQVCNWHTVDVAANGWENGFDLVLAHMTPAIASAEAFLKLSQASRDWCMMVKPTRRNSVVLDGLYTYLGMEPEGKNMNKTLSYALDLLHLKGINAKLDYEKQERKYEYHLEDVIWEYTARIESRHALTDQDKQKIRGYLSDLAEKDMVKETTISQIAAVYWQV